MGLSGGKGYSLMRDGFFITFEGPEGSGKTTHSKLLADFLKTKGYKVVYTREPGGVIISEKIRKILLDPRNNRMDILCEMFLYMAARAQIVKEKIKPALESGSVVISDRFMDATIVYQGYAGGIDTAIIKKIGLVATRGIRPDITFLLDIDAGQGLRRSGDVKDRMEKKPLQFHRKVREGYLLLAKKEPKRIKIISATGDIQETQDKIRRIVLERLSKGS